MTSPCFGLLRFDGGLRLNGVYRRRGDSEISQDLRIARKMKPKAPSRRGQAHLVTSMLSPPCSVLRETGLLVSYRPLGNKRKQLLRTLPPQPPEEPARLLRDGRVVELLLRKHF